MNLQFRETVWKAGFRPTEEAAAFEDRLRAKLGLQNRYDSARLSIGRSLADAHPPSALSPDAKMGKGIAGEHLFGDEVDLWISLLILDGELGTGAASDDFRRLVEAHWARGSRHLLAELEASGDDDARFLARLADLMPRGESPGVGAASLPAKVAGEIRLKVGTVSTAYPNTEPVDFVLNGQGTSPHIALMGKIGSGKTTTGVSMALEIASKAQIPFLMIDPKGEFVSGGNVTGRLSGTDVHAIEVGQEPIPLDFLPEPSIGSVSIQNAAMQFRDSLALCCRGAGDIQQDMLRKAIENVIRHERPRDLPAVRDWYKQELEREGKRHDSIMSRLNELTSLRCFVPTMQPADFFSRPWVLSLKTLGTEELKRLIILLVLDALKRFLLAQPDAPVVNGHRSFRHLLIIDEARRILAEKKYQSLADIVRQGRSKGSVVMLLSQDPSDFDGQADDFTTQLGTVIGFACSQSQRGLRALQGVYGRKLQPSEFSDTHLPPGVAFAKLPGRMPERIQCWVGDQ